DPARSVHFTGVLEKVAHEDDVAALTGDGAVVPHSCPGIATEAVRAAIKEICVVHVEGREGHHARYVDGPALAHHAPAGIDHQDTPVCRFKLAVNLRRIARNDPVKCGRVGSLMDPRDLSLLNGERLPVDDGLLREVVDIEVRRPESLEIHITGDDLLTAGIG